MLESNEGGLQTFATTEVKNVPRISPCRIGGEILARSS
jgi:hypothetical protein